MLESMVAWAVTVAPYVLIVAGALGLFLLIARLTTKFCSTAVPKGV